jgi:undecaprenyl-diphosphatase
MGSIAHAILGLHGLGALALVFLLPGLESSVLVGFIFPGEIAVILGGVLASQHKVSFPAVLVAAIAGAIIGDTIGYEVGKQWGRRLLHGTVGRIVKHEHLDRAERYLAERGGKAVFFGRFTAALRVMIPGLAGMAGMPYRTFLVNNAAGGVLWASGFVLLGYGAGNSWRRVEHLAGRASVLLLLLIMLGAGIVFAARWIGGHQDELAEFARRHLDRPRVAALRSRFQRPLDFVARRLSRDSVLGLSLTVSLVALVVAGWALGVITQDVVAGDDAARLDRPLLDWFVSHREPWLTNAAKIVTDLGSSAALIPLVIVAGAWWWWRRRTLRPLALLGTSYAGSEVLFSAVKTLSNRSRPPDALAVQHFHGLAFPSGHATQATAMWGMLAALIAAGSPSWRRTVAVWAAAIVIAGLVGLTRLYLGAHWLTDVLAGWAFGALWLTAMLAAARAFDHVGQRRARDQPSPPVRA